MTVDRVQRRMAAILAADVVGYSRLMGKDEESTFAVLKAYREIIDALIARHRGRVLNTASDSMLAEFPSVVDAVRCAIELQRAIGDENTKWGAQRAKDGHPAPFKLTYVEVGNEDPSNARGGRKS